MTSNHETFHALVDPSLLGHSNSNGNHGINGHSHGSMLDAELPIDPALFALEQTVNDVRRGKVKLDPGVGVGTGTSHTGREQIGVGSSSHHGSGNVIHTVHQSDGLGMTFDGVDAGLLDEDFDPAIREIVNSLTIAQQSVHAAGPNLTPAQAASAIDAHLADEEHHGIALRTLEDLTREGFGGFLSESFQQDSANFLLPAADDLAGPSNHLDSASDPHAGPSNLDSDANGKRSRGRPKGSKNKPKPGAPPPPPPPQRRPRGRPPKARSGEELVEYERRKEERAQGIKRQKGRPRKFPGYLVREMRLKRNRAEYRELLVAHQVALEDADEADILRAELGPEVEAEEEGMNGNGGGSGKGKGKIPMHLAEYGDDGNGSAGMDSQPGGDGGDYDWSVDVGVGMDVDEQTLLAAVGVNLNKQEQHAAGTGRGQGDGGVGGNGDGDGDGEVPSARAFRQGEEMEMRRVFGLPSE